MNIKEITQTAKEFCDKNVIPYPGEMLVEVDMIAQYCAQFLQAMIDQREVADTDTISEINRLQEKYDENGFDCSPAVKLERIEQHFQSALNIYRDKSTVSSAGKEVTEEEIKKKAGEIYDTWGESAGLTVLDCLIEMGEWASQFKSSPTSTEMPDISDEEIFEAAGYYVFDDPVNENKNWSNNDDTCGDNVGSFRDGAIWYRNKLKSRS